MKNIGADQLRGYPEADLRLCFRICKKPVFSYAKSQFSHDEAPLWILIRTIQLRWLLGTHNVLKNKENNVYHHLNPDFCTPGIYADGYIVFAFPFVCSSVRMFVCSFVIPSRSWNLRQSFALKFLKWCISQ